MMINMALITMLLLSVMVVIFRLYEVADTALHSLIKHIRSQLESLNEVFLI